MGSPCPWQALLDCSKVREEKANAGGRLYKRKAPREKEGKPWGLAGQRRVGEYETLLVIDTGLMYRSCCLWRRGDCMK